MTVYHEWVDFVIYPDNPRRVTSREARLMTSNAIVVTHSSQLPKAREQGARAQLSNILFDDDEFEAMEINDYGEVFIWTKRRVWKLFRLYEYEKLIFFPRHPPTSDTMAVRSSPMKKTGV